MKKWLFRLFLVGFMGLNLLAALQGYSFTHFSHTPAEKPDPNALSFLEKFELLFKGIPNPRPKNKQSPQIPYEVVTIPSGEEVLEAWYIPSPQNLGEVLLFHGYGSEKSAMLDRAKPILEMGFNTLLVDFRGSGGSTGNTTTIGYYEGQDVKASVEYLQDQGKNHIYLFGTSMGAAAIMKALSDDSLAVSGIILECPFGSLMQATKNRFEIMGVPTFPAANLLVFWGGVVNGFWGFAHDPIAYSKAIALPCLIIYGEKDKRVKPEEIHRIFENVKGPKRLVLFPEAGHVDYLYVDGEKWKTEVNLFLLGHSH
ncbi:MAG: alpha/beta fold hydrolase [Bacteroidota bacterium]